MPLESGLLTLHEDTRTVIAGLAGRYGLGVHGAFTLCTVFQKHGVSHYTSFASSGRRCNLVFFFSICTSLMVQMLRSCLMSSIHHVRMPPATALEVVVSFGQ
jgi:hypothetical protein